VPHVKTSVAVFIAVLLGWPLVVGADEAKPQTLPTVKVVPEIDFAKHPPLGRPIMSPDGEHIALSVHNTENGDDRYQLAVLHLPDLKFISRLDMTPKYLPTNITWVDNKRLVLSTAKEIGQLAAPVGTGDVIAVDYDGKNKRLLYSDSSRSSISSMATLLKMPLGFAQIGGTPDVPNGHFYLTVNPAAERGGTDAQAHRTLMFDVNAVNASVTQIAEIDKDGFDFLVDHAGVVRYAYGQLNNLQEVAYYRAAADQPWQQLAESVIGKHFEPYQMTADDKQLYSLGNPTGGPNEFAISNLDGTQRKVLASNPRSSIQRIVWTPPPLTPIAAIAADGKPVITYLGDDKYGKVLKALNAKFADHYVGIREISLDGSRVLISAVSDRDPGTYALLDMKTNNLQPLYQSQPWIQAEQMGERRPFWFKASSGTELGGFLTLPPNRAAKALPLIVLPHGGPIGPSDSWDYDPDSQFLATRGYAVVQINYRGSGGRGKAFEESGYKQWGVGIQQDIIDGVHWAIDQGYVDAKRICVYGGSFGGYSSLMQPIRAPELYKCAIDYAGVADLRIQSERSDTRRSRSGNSYLRAAMGKDDDQYTKDNSPIDLVDKFKVPVLIVHGEDDPRVPFENAKLWRSAMEKKGIPTEWLAKAKELHGFYKEENNEERYKVMEAFLEKYLGAGTPVASGAP
jgi:dipeptidyl aminopeptidase/acylaminoacyl peptidase